MNTSTIAVISICAFLLALFIIFLFFWFFHPTFKYNLTLHPRKTKAIIVPQSIRIIHPSTIENYDTDIPILPKQPVFTYDDEKTHKSKAEILPVWTTYRPQKFKDDLLSEISVPSREKHTWRDPKTYEQFTESELKTLKKSKKPSNQPMTSLEKHMDDLENRPVFLLTDPVDI